MTNTTTRLNFKSSSLIPPIVPSKFFMIMGQSNAHGQGIIDNEIDIPSPYVFELTSSNRMQIANDPLINNTHIDNDKMGFGMTFARSYAATTGENVAIILCAKSGTSLNSGKWKQGGEQYIDAKNVIIEMQRYGSELAGILWHQGESDSSVAGSPLYAANLKTMITDLREDIEGNSTAPFIVGSLADGYLLNTDASFPMANRNEVNNALIDAPNQIENCAFASLIGCADDLLHFTAPGLRLAGERYYQAYKEFL